MSSRVLVSLGMKIGLTTITAVILFAANIPMLNTAEGTVLPGIQESSTSSPTTSSPTTTTVVHLELELEPDRYLITNGSLSYAFNSIAEQRYNISTITLINQIDNDTRTIVEGINNIDELEQEIATMENSTEITAQPAAQQVYRLITIDCDEECEVLTCMNVDVWCAAPQ